MNITNLGYEAISGSQDWVILLLIAGGVVEIVSRLFFRSASILLADTLRPYIWFINDNSDEPAQEQGYSHEIKGSSVNVDASENMEQEGEGGTQRQKSELDVSGADDVSIDGNQNQEGE